MSNLSTDLELLADWCATNLPEDDHCRLPFLAAINSIIKDLALLEWKARHGPDGQYEREPDVVIVPMVRR